MISGHLFERYMVCLLDGKRQDCRELINRALKSGIDPVQVYHGVLWRAMENLAHMYRQNEINVATEHMATRICRSIADQVQEHLPRRRSSTRVLLLPNTRGKRPGNCGRKKSG